MRLIISGGGTGGHIYPALALARYIDKNMPGAKILFVGAQGGMEEKIIPRSGYPLKTLPVKGFPRKLSPRLAESFFLLGRSSTRAWRIIEEFDPDYIIGTGGFAAAPVLLAAILRRRNTIIHEQNVVPGLTNRFLAPFVDKVCLSFETSRKYFVKKGNVYVTGNPRASEVGKIGKDSAREILNLEGDVPAVLAVGGSRGAENLNKAVVDFLIAAARNGSAKNLQVLYITGELYYREIYSLLKQEGVLNQFGSYLQLYPYFQQMPLAWASADIAISRAGATTLAEITAIGVPSIIVPSPNVTNDHQLINARELSKQGAAVVMEEKDINGGLLLAKISEMLNNPSLLEQMQENNRRLSFPRAAENIAAFLGYNKRG